MRLILVVALVAFTGCHANVLRSEELSLDLDQVKYTIMQYVGLATYTADDTLRAIRESEMGKQVKAKITESAIIASQYAGVVQDQVSLLGQEAFTKISEQAERLSERLWQDVSTLRGQLEPYTEELQAQLAKRTKTVQENLAPYVEDLREKLDDLKYQLTAFWESPLTILPL
ncbi:hypothetical protein AAFF_G00126180 [Aldrovandia affinis]|uniref:Uncharacterized protein n=1 Tax=Aldrovandia affinis TaxID=143900 RepID=A0AAD7RR94_9TELE|nr:hypothetical protein AAFF_G00126180 [Aldrovandia affinis]